MSAAGSTKRPLDEEAYGRWGMIVSPPVLTPDGKRVLHLRADCHGRRDLHVRDLESGGEAVMEDVREAHPDPSGRFVVALLDGSPDADEAAADELLVLDFASGNRTRITGVEAFEVVPAYLVYLRPDATLVVREIESGDERTFDRVVKHVISGDGKRLLYREAGDPGVALRVDLGSGDSRRVLETKTRPLAMALDRAGNQAAFYVEGDGSPDACELLTWHGDDEPAAQRRDVLGGLPHGWHVVPAGPPWFSASGRRLWVTVAPVAETPPKHAAEIWRWDDPLLPSERLRELQDGLPAYRLVLHLPEWRAVLLESPDLPDVDLDDDGDGTFAVGADGLPYRREAGWEEPARRDHYLVDVRDGSRTLLRRDACSDVELSPEQGHALWWNAIDRAWYATDLETMRARNLTGDLPSAFHDEDWDRPGPPDPYGVAGWIDGDRRVLLYDRYDLWTFDPAGEAKPRNLTAGEGRRREVRFRRADHGAIGGRLLLHGFDEGTKSSGFYRQDLEATGPPVSLIEADRELKLIAVAGSAAEPRCLFTRQSVTEFPDLWIADGDFRQAHRISETNPQQADYNWATAELVEWTQPDGSPGCGVLYKPEDFAAGTRYPLVVFCYARWSDSVHHHFTPPPLPQPVINPLVYASGGYLVLVPDIRFRIGTPGRSAFDAVTSGVRHLVDAGLVDERRIGGGSHSWGGYEMAFIATRSEMFRAISAGAPVANMTSSYGEIRSRTGRSRMFEYEQAQSRIGETLWQAPEAYIENSPIFAVDRIRTPLLILHNENDGAVPQSEGLQLFLGMRRLGKPAWLVSYPGEGHLLGDPRNRLDWDRRLRQFFDHYLMDAPEPDWIRA